MPVLPLKYFEDRIGLRMEVINGCPDYYYKHNDHAVAEGRMLECVPFPGASLGERQHKTRLSPQMPYGMTHHDIFSAGGSANMPKWDFAKMGERLTNDERCLGPGLLVQAPGRSGEGQRFLCRGRNWFRRNRNDAFAPGRR